MHENQLTAGMSVETVTVLETHIDHLTGEEVGVAFDRLQEAGALDVMWIPGIMKKNRPAGVFRVVCRPSDKDRLTAVFFRHTHTLGIRRMDMERIVLPREHARLTVSGESLEAKAYHLEGQTFVRPEHEALARKAVSEDIGVPAYRMGRKGENEEN